MVCRQVPGCSARAENSDGHASHLADLLQTLQFWTAAAFFHVGLRGIRASCGLGVCTRPTQVVSALFLLAREPCSVPKASVSRTWSCPSSSWPCPSQLWAQRRPSRGRISSTRREREMRKTYRPSPSGGSPPSSVPPLVPLPFLHGECDLAPCSLFRRN